MIYEMIWEQTYLQKLCMKRIYRNSINDENDKVEHFKNTFVRLIIKEWMKTKYTNKITYPLIPWWW